MGGIRFAKAHALGNDFLLLESSELEGREPGALARYACDRHAGVGADGLVVLGPPATGDASFHIFNADGSEAQISGNALRCAAAWLLARAGHEAAEAGRVIQFETRLGLRRVFLVGSETGAWFFRVDMGRPGFAAAEVPFRPPRAVPEPITGFRLPLGGETVEVAVLSMGNPQCVLFVEDFSLLNWRGLGAEIERHPYFPQRTNVAFARVEAPERIEARFWERGAGYTQSSGTGACAGAVAAHLAGKTGRRVTVAVERGELEVHWLAEGMVELTGPAAITAEGTFFL